MIRVLHVIDHLDLGGAQTAVLDMLRHRDQSAFDVEVAAMHGRGPFAGALEEMGIRVHFLADHKWPPAYLANFARLLRSADFQVLHFHLQGANWIAKPLAALVGQGIRIAHDHTSGDLRFRGVSSLLPDACSHLFSSRVIAVSKGVRDFLIRWERVPSNLIELVPNAVDHEIFRPCSEEEKREARGKLRLPQEAFVSGCIGRLAREKNLILLPRLAVLHPEVTFVVAGAGPECHRISRLASRLGVASRVCFLGTILDRPAFYRALDTFLLPSLYEGLPMVMLEAMASGAPILASALEGITSVLAPEQEGLLAPAGHLAGFSRQLKRLEDSPGLRRRLAQAARTKCLSQFAASETARRIEAIYRQELSIANAKAAAKNSAG
jgi:glycosyltransferase involved in cell wall biosynthesis